MKLAFLAFTEKGFALAGSLAQTLGGSVMRCGKPDSLSDWTAFRPFGRGQPSGPRRQ